MVFVLDPMSGKGETPVASTQLADMHAVWQVDWSEYAVVKQTSIDVTHMQKPSHICEGAVVTAAL